MKRFALWVAEGFGIGRMPVVPGTFGSLLGFGWLWLLLRTGRLWMFCLGILVGFFLSVWLCGVAEKILRKKDPTSVVLDEITALPVCFAGAVVHFWSIHRTLPEFSLLFSKGSWYVAAGVFVLFRLFDIVKPWPIRASQGLIGGWGITVDDFLAAIYVLILERILSHFFPLI